MKGQQPAEKSVYLYTDSVPIQEAGWLTKFGGANFTPKADADLRNLATAP